MMIQIRISKTLALPSVQTRYLRKLLKDAAKIALTDACPLPEAEISLVLSDDIHLQDLNRNFLGIDSVTDVLSFPGGEVDPESGRTNLGDIVISYPQAKTQATDGGHPLDAELQLLTVHGVLHLCGYDHAEHEDKLKMWDRQAKILSKLDCPIRGPAE